MSTHQNKVIKRHVDADKSEAFQDLLVQLN
jgi:hypothetical protein